MKFVALLRGINVGGNALIKMPALKDAVEKAGYNNVSTYIASGNVLFESDKSMDKIRDKLEKDLSKIFKLDLKIILRSRTQLKEVLNNVPGDWKKNNLRCYIAFVREPVTVAEVFKEVQPKEGVDSVKTGEGVIYLSTRLEGLTKSGFTKLVGKKIYKEITIRNYNTAQKVLALMEQVG